MALTVFPEVLLLLRGVVLRQVVARPEIALADGDFRRGLVVRHQRRRGHERVAGNLVLLRDGLPLEEAGKTVSDGEDHHRQDVVSGPQMMSARKKGNACLSLHVLSHGLVVGIAAKENSMLRTRSEGGLSSRHLTPWEPDSLILCGLCLFSK